ncbi:BRO-N domain-containing protein [Pannonibacter sp. SL95]|uniref:BRO-N domain-containing protein n=1 Tax=Pannonibacter sp. SL95 TaxID=2995153 RepID=UPI00227348EE|nr:Bro-N domain-containing protein [Pannonibacter sp. SL95]MCY1705849.1 Bro-N domain-containing protein [Pannonibacter sp. SL95]
MQYTMQVFENDENEEFRVVDRDGEPWFVLTEVCKKLEIANPSDAASRLDDDEKDALGITDAIGRRQRTTIINESGLYSVILRSNKPEAKRFKKWITSEVLPSIRKTGGYSGKVPAFIRRYNDNWDRVEQGHFSVINELVVHLWGRFEHAGYIIKDRAPNGTEIRPDSSVGRRFADWLAKKHPTVSTAFSYYIHKTPEWEGEARQYPFAVLPLFREYLDEVWIPEHAADYFRTRDAGALPYLPKLLPSPDKPKAGMTRRVTGPSRRAG